MGGALARHGPGSPHGRKLLLLSWVPRAGHRPNARRQQARVGELRYQRATGHRGRCRRRIHPRPRGFNANNALGLQKLRDQGTVKILEFSDSVLKELYRISKDVVAEAGSDDDLSKEIYAS